MDTFVPHDQRSKYVWFDGQIVKSGEPVINMLTHGLHYGSAVFEGNRAYEDENGNGNIFLLRQHTERLREGCEHMQIPLLWTNDEIDKACNDIVAANGLKECYIRPIAYLGSEDLRVQGREALPHLAIAAYPLPSVAAKEVKLIISETRRAPAACLPVHTKSSAMFYAGRAGLNEAEAAGFNDAVFLDISGNLADCSAANIFLLIDGELHTPEADSILPGITQKTFFKLAEKRGINVVVRNINPVELANATGAFLCGTAAEAKPVIQIGEHKYSRSTVIDTLIDAYDLLVRQTPEKVDAYLGISGGVGL